MTKLEAIRRLILQKEVIIDISKKRIKNKEVDARTKISRKTLLNTSKETICAISSVSGSVKPLIHLTELDFPM